MNAKVTGSYVRFSYEKKYFSQYENLRSLVLSYFQTDVMESSQTLFLCPNSVPKIQYSCPRPSFD